MLRAFSIFVGGLRFAVTEGEIRALFENHGVVNDVRIIVDAVTGTSRGFGFVQMAREEDAQRAISALDGWELQGRPLRVSVARVQP